MHSFAITCPIGPYIANTSTSFSYANCEFQPSYAKKQGKKWAVFIFFAIFARCFIVNNDVLNFAIRWIA